MDLRLLFRVGRRALQIALDPEQLLEVGTKMVHFNPVRLHIAAIKESLPYKATIKALSHPKVRQALAQTLPESIREKVDPALLIASLREPMFRSFLYLILTPSLVKRFFPFFSSLSRYFAMVVIVCTAAFYRKIANGRIYEIPPEAAEKLKGKTVVMTGASDGIGFQTAVQLVSLQPDRLILGVRGDKQRRTDVAKKIKNELEEFANVDVIVLPLDLASFASVRGFVGEVKKVCPGPVDIVICNAGTVGAEKPEEVTLTEDKLEPTIQVNVLSHYYLLDLLMPLILQSEVKKVVMTSSTAHMQCQEKYLNWENYSKRPEAEGYRAYDLYCASKLAQLYHMRKLMAKFGDKGLKVYAVHPGAVRTKLLGRGFGVGVAQQLASLLFYVFGKDTAAGSSTLLYCVLDEIAKPGGYHMECRPTPMSRLARNEAEANRFCDSFAEKILATLAQREYSSAT